MESNSPQDTLNAEQQVKKQWLKPDIEIISNVVESGLSAGSFEPMKTVHITGPTGIGTAFWNYHS
jgi:hypothetical protein